MVKFMLILLSFLLLFQKKNNERKLICIVFCCICSIYLKEKSDRIRFHKLPQNIIRRKQWLAAIEKKIKNFSYTENSVICSQHFTKDCYIRTSYGRFKNKHDINCI